MLAEPRCLLDFPDPIAGSPQRLAFGAPDVVLSAASLGEVVSVIDAAECAARDGAWVIGFVAYEAAPAFDAALGAELPGRLPLAWFAVHHDEPVAEDRPVRDEMDEPSLKVVARVHPDDYARGVARIREYIAAGDVYQVNYTIPFVAHHDGEPRVMYERMVDAQRGRWSAYLDLGGARIMSASPELFFERRGSLVRMRPMKGTTPRGLSAHEDLLARDALLQSQKDRAENVMIVDLVRNDLGRIARTGSVRVTALCEAERYPRVWQLTSTVEAEVPGTVPLSGVFRALFPCGSVTGAPKVRATEIIRELETVPRESYCGAIGVIRPGGDAAFNVAIRTAWTDDGGATVHLNSGGAVTIDSTAAGELAELHAKVAAFTRAVVTPSLFETVRVKHGVPLRLDRHLARLAASAGYFGIPCDVEHAAALLTEVAERNSARPVARGRILLEAGGSLRAEVVPFDEAPSIDPLPVEISSVPVCREDLRLYHKTTDRSVYDAALRDHPGLFDVLLRNEAGEATEFTRGNLVALLDGVRCTPPVACGLLPGTLRGELLDSGEIVERTIPVVDLQRAAALWFINSLRGWVPVRFG